MYKTSAQGNAIARSGDVNTLPLRLLSGCIRSCDLTSGATMTYYCATYSSIRGIVGIGIREVHCMQQIRRLYQKHPIIVTCIAAFLLRFPVTAIILVPVYYALGADAYSFLFVPVLCGEQCCIFLALRRAMLIPIRKHAPTTSKGKTCRICYHLLSAGFYLFLLTAVVSLLGFT